MIQFMKYSCQFISNKYVTSDSKILTTSDSDGMAEAIFQSGDGCMVTFGLSASTRRNQWEGRAVGNHAETDQ